MRVMRQVWEENYCVFGVRKMHAFLNTHELGVGYVARCTVERLMRRMAFVVVSRRRTRPCHGFSRRAMHAPWIWSIGILGPVISTSCGSRTSPTCQQAGWVYVSFVTDVCSRKILGWKVASSLHTDVALDALNMAIYQRRRDDIDTRGSCTTPTEASNTATCATGKLSPDARQ